MDFVRSSKSKGGNHRDNDSFDSLPKMSRGSYNQPIQKKEKNEEEKIKPTAQLKKEEGKKETPSNSDSKGQVTSLPAELLEKFENAFGFNFSFLKIFKDSDQAEKVNAQAFTAGDEIHFAPGKFDPHTAAGQELIGHELAHVVQQKKKAVTPNTKENGSPVNDSPSLEKQAAEKGAKAAKGEPAFIKGTGNAAETTTTNNDPLKVAQGQVTFDSEGNDNEKSRYFTRKAHYPGGVSGVTIGRGYDLAHRGKKELIIQELKDVGIDHTKFESAIGLKGEKAQEWITKNAKSLPTITHEQQKLLFTKTYEAIEADTKRLATKADVTKAYGATDWDNLQKPIKEILVDLRYRGDYSSRSRKIIQKHVANNDLKEFYKVMADKNNWKSVPKDRFNRRVEFLKGYLNEDSTSDKPQETKKPSAENNTGKVHADIGKSIKYTVKPGETIGLIAKKFGITTEELMNANKDKLHGNKSPYFYANAVILIPKQ